MKRNADTLEGIAFGIWTIVAVGFGAIYALIVQYIATGGAS